MQDDGIIPDCSTSGCWKKLGERRCCDFQQGNYIVLYPGELDRARAEGRSTAHLEVIEADYHGGQKVTCSATNTATCDNGFKPLDCQSYPFFPAHPGRGDVDLLVKGTKCPLQVEHLANHAATVQEAWGELIDIDPAVREWLNKVELVGYSEPLHPFLEPEVPLSDTLAA
jgi:hypothetical protein